MPNEDTPIRALLTGLIDYAGLFPPAGLDMASVVHNYASYLAGSHSWLVGRLIVPVDCMDNFEQAASPYFAGRDWPVALLGAPSQYLSHGHGYVVDCIECKPAQVEDIVASGSIPSYYEVATAQPDADMETVIDAIRRVGGRAKIRTGGLTSEGFPSADRIARFMFFCHQAGVPFKATAGLHHPICGVHPFTYEPNSARGQMHGFLNLFLAAAVIFSGGSEWDSILVLQEQSAEAFNVTADLIGWRNYRYNASQIRELRKQFATGFGSCAFEEPVSDLIALGFL